MDMLTSHAEADVICRYLIGRRAAPPEALRYVSAVATLGIDVGSERLWSVGCSHPFLLGLVDAGLAIMHPTSSMRRKIHLMAAILEATPHNVDWFLKSPSGLLRVAVIGGRAVLRSVTGLLLVAWLGDR